MRISTLQMFRTGQLAITDLSEQNIRTQEKISTGKRILRPSDDPVAATRILGVNADLSASAQYQENITAARNRLNLTDGVLDGITDVLQRVRDLTLSANNGANTYQDRQYIATEIRSRVEELTALLNTKDSSNNYLFSGFDSRQLPFEKGGKGLFEYKGDQQQREITVSAGFDLSISVDSYSLFGSIETVNPTLSVRHSDSLDPANDVVSMRVVDEDQYAALGSDSLQIRFNSPLEVDPALENITILNNRTGEIIANNVVVEEGQNVQAAGIDFIVRRQLSAGESVLVETKRHDNLLNIIDSIDHLLVNVADNSTDSFQQGIDRSILQIDNTIESVLDSRTSIGTRLNVLDTAEAVHQQSDLANKEVLSKLQDLDYAEAVSQLSFESFVLEAAQTSFAQVSRLSLFDFV